VKYRGESAAVDDSPRFKRGNAVVEQRSARHRRLQHPEEMTERAVLFVRRRSMHIGREPVRGVIVLNELRCALRIVAARVDRVQRAGADHDRQQQRERARRQPSVQPGEAHLLIIDKRTVTKIAASINGPLRSIKKLRACVVQLRTSKCSTDAGL